VEKYVDAVAEKAGAIDISFSAISAAQGVAESGSLLKLSAEHFALPIMAYMQAVSSRHGALGIIDLPAWSGWIHRSLQHEVATFLLSLRALTETGKGKPSPDDLKIDNWN
jgi:hypothetical protein